MRSGYLPTPPSMLDDTCECVYMCTWLWGGVWVGVGCRLSVCGSVLNRWLPAALGASFSRSIPCGPLPTKSKVPVMLPHLRVWSQIHSPISVTALPVQLSCCTLDVCIIGAGGGGMGCCLSCDPAVQVVAVLNQSKL